jgi:hypothetical protein
LAHHQSGAYDQTPILCILRLMFILVYIQMDTHDWMSNQKKNVLNFFLKLMPLDNLVFENKR